MDKLLSLDALVRREERKRKADPLDAEISKGLSEAVVATRAEISKAFGKSRKVKARLRATI